MDKYGFSRGVRLVFFLALAWSLFFIPSFVPVFCAEFVQRVEIPSSPNPVGSGARALGMGGAFISIADDATSASWNPGGLVQLELPEVSIVGTGFERSEDNDFALRPDASGKQSLSRENLNYVSTAYPFTLFNRNMIVSVNYQHLYDFARSWRFPMKVEGTASSTVQDVAYDQDGRLYALGLAYGFQVTPDFSLGVTINIWDDLLHDNQWEQKTVQAGSGQFSGNPFSYSFSSTDTYRLKGYNANLGLLWRLNEKLTIGAVLKTPFRADISHEFQFQTQMRFPSFPEADSQSFESHSWDEKLDMPMSYGIGAAWRFSDTFTAAVDLYRTHWDDFVLINAQGEKVSPVTNKKMSESRIDPTFQARLGGEYLLIKEKRDPTKEDPDRHVRFVIPFRAGLFYDPAPAQGSPDDFYGFSLGSGIAFNRCVFDVAYQFRFGRDVGGGILENLGFSQDLHEHMVYGSLIFHF